jgi:hypothetical protein
LGALPGLIDQLRSGIDQCMSADVDVTHTVNADALALQLIL